MTVDETLKVFAVLKANYTNFYKSMSRTDATAVVNLWAEMFADVDYSLIGAAVKAYIATDTKGFPPNVGQINEQIRKLTSKEQMTEQEAVSLILKATRNGLYGAKEEFDKLPPILQRLVGSPEQIRSWSLMSEDDIQTVVASNLMRSYRVVAKQEEYREALPMSLKAMIETTADKLRLEM